MRRRGRSRLVAAGRRAHGVRAALERVSELHETYEERRFCVGPGEWEGQVERLRAAAGSAFFGVFRGQIGLEANEGVFVTAYPTRLAQPLRARAPRRAADVRASAWSRPCAPSAPPPTRPGVYAFRKFDIRMRTRPSSRSVGAGVAGFRVELRRADRRLVEEPRRARARRAFPPADSLREPRDLEASRADVGRPEFARRHKLTRATRVVTSTLHGADPCLPGQVTRRHRGCTPRRSGAPPRRSSRSGSWRASPRASRWWRRRGRSRGSRALQPRARGGLRGSRRRPTGSGRSPSCPSTAARRRRLGARGAPASTRAASWVRRSSSSWVTRPITRASASCPPIASDSPSARLPPRDSFMALELVPGALARVRGRVRYAPNSAERVGRAALRIRPCARG